MPTLRIMPDGRPIYATPGAPDQAGVPSFSVGGGETVALAVDYTAFLGVTATISASAWSAESGTVTAPAVAGQVATGLLAVPSVPLPVSYDYALQPSVTIHHTMTASDGRVCRTTFRIYPEPR